MNHYEKDKRLLKQRLDEYRYRHSLAVAEQASHLAKRYGGDIEKAYRAGLLHDITKNDSPDSQLACLKRAGVTLTPIEQCSPKLWHAITGALVAQSDLSIEDGEIVSAIRYHTTGKAGMTLLEKIIYIADYTSADRTYPDAQTVRQLVEEDLDKAVLYALSYTVSHLSARQVPIHPDTIEAYNELSAIRTGKEG